MYKYLFCLLEVNLAAQRGCFVSCRQENTEPAQLELVGSLVILSAVTSEKSGDSATNLYCLGLERYTGRAAVTSHIERELNCVCVCVWLNVTGPLQTVKFNSIIQLIIGLIMSHPLSFIFVRFSFFAPIMDHCAELL